MHGVSQKFKLISAKCNFWNWNSLAFID